ncbi:MAG: argininosuccinate lyase [Deltaproteobacteria bacterium]|jgi:argininosuccinate lyase|nr:argininosuccinate lyase [Deltaproteobacteria bacterium]MCL5880665.1 argininosuccinate lyase [Deltaproteobacteria bacterium]MDA8305176.1 argininosuccinate lyase [Deltaproteobacteria bacterium]
MYSKKKKQARAKEKESKTGDNFVRGRFKEDISGITADFTSSLDIDKRLADFDIAGSIAHLYALRKAGVVSEKEKKEIEKSLLRIKEDIKSGAFKFDKRYEDIHMNIEKRLTLLAPVSGAKLHTARSRNDQVSIDFRLYVKNEIKKVALPLLDLRLELVNIAKKNINTILPGYTHLQHAQPVSLAHHILAYYEMFTRDFERLINCYAAADVLTLGSGALAGVDFEIDRQLEAKMLGFAKISRNSMDSVSDRDFALEFNFALSMIMMHLSRFCEELIIWNSEEFGFIELKDEFTTGSSIMPQKKNPDVLELIRGKTGGVISNLLSLFIMMKALPLTYNRDMQEDKKPVMESADTVYNSILIFKEIIKTVKFNAKNMRRELDDDFIYATDIATYLVKKGIPFRKSHEIVGQLVNYAKENKKTLSKLKIEEYKKICGAIENDIFEVFNPSASANLKKSYGGTALSRVKSIINDYEEEIERNKKSLERLKQ